MFSFASPTEWALGALLLSSALGMLLARKPVHACLSFLLMLLTLAVFYLHLSAEFIATIQILAYGGAILVLFMFVIILFQDAHQKIRLSLSKSSLALLLCSAGLLFVSLFFLGERIKRAPSASLFLPSSFGEARGVGEELYTRFFFPFEVASVLFLIALVGAFYLAKKEN